MTRSVHDAHWRPRCQWVPQCITVFFAPKVVPNALTGLASGRFSSKSSIASSSASVGPLLNWDITIKASISGASTGGTRRGVRLWPSRQERGLRFGVGPCTPPGHEWRYYTGLCRRVWRRAGGAAHAPNGIVTLSGVSARCTCARVQHTTRRGGVARMSIEAAPEGQPVRRKRRQELRWRRRGQLEDDQLCL